MDKQERENTLPDGGTESVASPKSAKANAALPAAEEGAVAQRGADDKKFNLKREAYGIAVMLVAALFGAFGMHVFVYPAAFAPTGVDGIATMLQDVTRINAGIYTLALNLPLFIGAWFLVNRRYVIYTTVFIVVTSLLLILLEKVNMWQYATPQSPEFGRLIAALVSGVMLGVRTGLMFRIGGSAGGADVIASMVQAKRPYMRVERATTLICMIITVMSFFVYRDVNCILLSLVQLVVFERVMDRILAPTRSAIEVRIVTRHPDEIRQELLFRFKHGGTITDSHGLYTGEGTSVITSVINVRQLAEFSRMIQKYPDSFAYYSDVRGVIGNFRWRKDDAAK